LNGDKCFDIASPPGLLLESRDGAGNESVRSHLTGHGEEDGYDGWFDRRRGQPFPKRVPLAVVEQALSPYCERYFDLNVQHFHQKPQAEHDIQLSYTSMKAALQGAGLVARGRKRGGCIAGGASGDHCPVRRCGCSPAPA